MPTSSEQLDKLLTVQQAAARLHCSTGTIRAMLKDSRLTGTLVAKRWLISRESIESHLPEVRWGRMSGCVSKGSLMYCKPHADRPITMLTESEAGDRLMCRRITISYLLNAGWIEGTRSSDGWQVTPDSVDKFLTSREYYDWYNSDENADTAVEHDRTKQLTPRPIFPVPGYVERRF